MITTKKLKVPVFKAALTINIADNIEEFENHFLVKDNFEIKPCTDAFCVVIEELNCINLFFEYETSISVLAHECEHIKNRIWKCIGHVTDLDYDEPDSYLIEYLIEEVLKVQKKHNNKK